MAVTAYPATAAAPGSRKLMAQSVPLLISAVFLLPLAVVAYSGTLSRYVADDYCTASIVLERGLVGAETFWYTSWSGRFGFFVIIDLLNLAGEWTVPLTPVVLLTTWVALSAATIRQLTNRAATWPWSAALAVALVSATVALAPSLWQSVYWQTGSVTYLLPLILLTGFAAIALHVRSLPARCRTTRLWQALGAALVVLAVGSSETSMALTDAALAFTTALMLLAYRQEQRSTLLIALAAAALASAVVVAAPGNHVRGTLVSDHLALWQAGLFTAVYPLLILAEMLVFRAPGYVLLVFAAGLAAGYANGIAAPKHSAKAHKLIWAGGYLTMAASSAPAFVAMGDRPPLRADIEPVIVALLVILATGFLVGLRKDQKALLGSNPNKRIAATVLGVVALGLTVGNGPVMSTLNALSQTSALETYAADIDQLETVARGSDAHDGGLVVVNQVRMPGMVGLSQVGTESNSWQNICAARFFRVPAIAATGAG